MVPMNWVRGGKKGESKIWKEIKSRATGSLPGIVVL